jgi:hypothetical protein
MPAIALLLSVVFIFLLIVLPIWTFIRAKAAEELGRRLQDEVMGEIDVWLDERSPELSAAQKTSVLLPVPVTPITAVEPKPLINWELFMGVNLGGVVVVLLVVVARLLPKPESHP